MLEIPSNRMSKPSERYVPLTTLIHGIQCSAYYYSSIEKYPNLRVLSSPRSTAKMSSRPELPTSNVNLIDYDHPPDQTAPTMVTAEPLHSRPPAPAEAGAITITITTMRMIMIIGANYVKVPTTWMHVRCSPATPSQVKKADIKLELADTVPIAR